MSNERRILYIWAGISFILGIILGMILFYGQLRSNPSVFDSEYIYDTRMETVDFFRVSYLNMLWLFSIIIAHNVLPIGAVHSIVSLRGCAGSYCLMYTLSFAGIKEAVVSVLPQCFSILPLMAVFSAEVVMRRRENIRKGAEPFSLKRRDVLGVFLFSSLAAGVEMLLFRLLCMCLL